MADAGLDQRVSVGSAVHLDATGTVHPDGTIESYEWEIIAPDGERISPECENCARTQFVAGERGRYEVIVTVEDEAERTDRDTLYVRTYDAGPGVTLEGPAEPAAGSSAAYTATATAERASLESIRWLLDGEEVSEGAIEGDRAELTHNVVFDSSDARQLRVLVIDEGGREATDALQIEPKTPDLTSDEDSSPGTSPPAEDLVVDGPQLLTGEKPLTGSYSIDGASSEAVDAVVWQINGESIRGADLTRTWSPGDHTLHAEVHFDDGSSERVQFADGSREVIANPRPEIEIDDLDRWGGIKGEAIATDEYGTLEKVSVSIAPDIDTPDDEQIRFADMSRQLADRQPSDQSRVDLPFETTDVEGGDEYVIVASATDERGQMTIVREEIVPAKRPEVVRSEVVNDPVDTYHPKLDEERYAAEFVVEMDLNGVPAESIVVKPREAEENISVISDEPAKRYHSNSDRMEIRTEWSSIEAGEEQPVIEWSVTENPSWRGSAYGTFEIESSPPEIRTRVLVDPIETPWISGRTPGLVSDATVVIDASESFDPDGSEVSYHWEREYNQGPRESTYEIADMAVAELTVSDNSEATTSEFVRYEDSYVPEAVNFEVVDTNPATDEVTVQMTTEIFRTNLDQFDIEIGTDVRNADADLDSWEKVAVGDDESLADLDPDPVERPTWWIDHAYYEGTITLPRSAFRGDRPTLVLYNEADPTYPRISHEFTDLEMDETAVAEAEIIDVEYIVEQPVNVTATATTAEERDEYLADGYELTGQQTDTVHVIEERQKIPHEEVDTETRSFDTSRDRWEFVQKAEEWTPSGTRTTTETRPTKQTEWRSSRGGYGSYTGNTRQVQASSAEYLREYQFRYERTVERTGTREERVCPAPRICHTQEEEYTYEETEERTYWDTSALSSSHSRTGASRSTRVSGPTYETEYEYEYTSYEQVETTEYLAERDVIVSSTEYEWVESDRITSASDAKLITLQSDYRRGGTAVSETWDLTKMVGVNEVGIDTPEIKRDVIQTNILVKYQTDGEIELKEKSIRGYSDQKKGKSIICPDIETCFIDS